MIRKTKDIAYPPVFHRFWLQAFFFFLWGGGALISPCFAAINLLQAYQAARKNNDPAVASQVALLQISRARLNTAKSSLRPSVDALFSVSPQVSTGTATPYQNERSYSLQLSYPLFRPQAVSAEEQAELQTRAESAGLISTQQALILHTARAYFDWLSSDEDLAALAAQKQFIVEQLAVAKRNFEIGNTSVIDQQEAQARFDFIIAQQAKAQNTRSIKRATLDAIVGEPLASDKAACPIYRLRNDFSPTVPGDLADWIALAKRTNPLLIKQRLQTESTRVAVRKAREERYPAVDFVGSVGYDAATGSGPPSYEASIGLQVSLPIDLRERAKASIQEAEGQLLLAQAQFAQSEREVELAVRSAFSSITGGPALTKALQTAARSSQLALESSQLGQEIGVRINLDVLDAQQLVFSTRRDLAKARYELIMADLQLRATAGVLGERDLEAMNAYLEPPSDLPAGAYVSPQ